MKFNNKLLLLSCFFSSVAIAQTNYTTLQNKLNEKNNVSYNTKNDDKDFSNEQIIKLNSLLATNNYIEFYEYIKNTNITSSKYISYLESKKFEGHVPLYWLMADYYSKQKGKEEDTHFWYDTAIIMTLQDSYLCYDVTAKYASDKLSKAFPNPLNTIRSNPQYNASVMPKVIFFISNLKQRINPKWVCVFGDTPVRPHNDVLRPINEWNNIRQEIFEKFKKDYPQ